MIFEIYNISLHTSAINKHETITVSNDKLLIYHCLICLIFKNYRKFCRTTCKTILEYIKYVLISEVLTGYWAEKEDRCLRMNTRFKF